MSEHSCDPFWWFFFLLCFKNRKSLPKILSNLYFFQRNVSCSSTVKQISKYGQNKLLMWLSPTGLYSRQWLSLSEFLDMYQSGATTYKPQLTSRNQGYLLAKPSVNHWDRSPSFDLRRNSYKKVVIITSDHAFQLQASFSHQHSSSKKHLKYH